MTDIGRTKLSNLILMFLMEEVDCPQYEWVTDKIMELVDEHQNDIIKKALEILEGK
jgi:hypothetical protein